jgi:hypothetical protein
MPSIENNKLGYANSHRSLISTHKLPISLVLGKVVDLCCVASSVSHILSFSAKDYLDAVVWKKKSQLIENIYKENYHISAQSICLEDTAAHGKNYLSLPSLNKIPGNPKYLIDYVECSEEIKDQLFRSIFQDHIIIDTLENARMYHDLCYKNGERCPTLFTYDGYKILASNYPNLWPSKSKLLEDYKNLNNMFDKPDFLRSVSYHAQNILHDYDSFDSKWIPGDKAVNSTYLLCGNLQGRSFSLRNIIDVLIVNSLKLVVASRLKVFNPLTLKDLRQVDPFFTMNDSLLNLLLDFTRDLCDLKIENMIKMAKLNISNGTPENDGLDDLKHDLLENEEEEEEEEEEEDKDDEIQEEDEQITHEEDDDDDDNNGDIFELKNTNTTSLWERKWTSLFFSS